MSSGSSSDSGSFDRVLKKLGILELAEDAEESTDEAADSTERGRSTAPSVVVDVRPDLCSVTAVDELSEEEKGTEDVI